MNKGFYIVFQGVEGAGKSTQIGELERKLNAAGLATKVLKEPESKSDLTSRAISLMTKSPHYRMSADARLLLYSAARIQTLNQIKKFVDRGVICLVENNFLTSLGAEFYGPGGKSDYDSLSRIIEFGNEGFEADMTLILDVTVKQLVRRADKNDSVDRDYLENIRRGLLTEARKRHLMVIDGNRSLEEVAAAVWVHTKALLAGDNPPKQKTRAAASNQPVKLGDIIADKTAEPLLEKAKDGHYLITDNGKEFLDRTVTDSEGDVYAFTEKLPVSTVAAAMARLSRRGDDTRITLLDEFAGQQGKDDALLERVITAYGDDSVQQLAGIHVVVENASNLLTKKLEWGRLASYLEQSTRYIYFDQKDRRGNYKYFTPKNLNATCAKEFESTMDNIFEIYSYMVRSLTEYIRGTSSVAPEDRDLAFNSATRAQACDAIRAVLPIATKSTVGIYASGQALENMIMNLQADDLEEARETGQRILTEARKVMGVFLERADKPERGGATIAYRANTKLAVKKFTEENLTQKLSPQTSDVTLLDYWPKNELDLLPAMLFEHSDLPIDVIKREVDDWSYAKKVEAFKTYIGDRLNRRHRPGRALENAHYSFELVCDYGIFRDLQRHRMVDDMQWQKLSPRYGYEIPKIVEEAGLSDNFERCFDLSYKLYSLLISEGYDLEAQYATLMGHKMRSKVTMNAREAFHWMELRTTPQGHPGYRKLTQSMYEVLRTKHPLMGESMKFINQDEDPELTRLAAERYTQYKLQQLDKK